MMDLDFRILAQQLINRNWRAAELRASAWLWEWVEEEPSMVRKFIALGELLLDALEEMLQETHVDSTEIEQLDDRN